MSRPRKWPVCRNVYERTLGCRNPGRCRPCRDAGAYDRQYNAANPTLVTGGQHIRVKSLPDEWQPVAEAIIETRRLIK